MSVKIINVLKDDSFNDILELFRDTSADEVILVLPKVGKLFRNEDHFAAFASEALGSKKSISILTSVASTASLARKYGFNVMSTGSERSSKSSPSKATVAAAMVPTDFDIPNFDDAADLGDVPLTSDQTTGNTGDDYDEEDPLRNMHIEDDEGNILDEKEAPGMEDSLGDEVLATATLAAAPKSNSQRTPIMSAVDGVRIGVPSRTFTPVAKPEKPAKIPVQRGLSPEETALAAGSDYIDTVWRGMKTNTSPLQRTFSSVSRVSSSARISKRVAITMVVTAALVLAGAVYLMTGSVRVAIVPVSKQLDTTISIQSSDVFSTIDEAFAKLPGQLIEVSKTAEHTVPATGRRDVASKARGMITLYNAYSSTGQPLVTNTRLATSDGKLFRTLQSIVVPGSTMVAGATIPGKIAVDVIADAPGANYNIPPSDFVIVAFKEKGDTSKAAAIYGKSDAAMSGGASGPSSVITQANYDEAKRAALALVKEQIQTSISAQGSDLQVLNQDSLVISNLTSSANADDAGDSVTVSATGTIKTIAFRKADLMDLLERTILRNEHVSVDADDLSVSFKEIAYNKDLATLSFKVAMKGAGYAPIDAFAITQDIRGLSSAGISNYFKAREDITSASVFFSPFWVRSAPRDASKIKLEIKHSAEEFNAR